jgi:iron(III) transport system ATP-binding protein
MSKGRIEQKGRPHDIYARPVNAYVSNFIGVANLLKGRVVNVAEPGRGAIEVAQDGINITLPCQLGPGITAGQDVMVSVRPENVTAAPERANGADVEGEVLAAIFLGNCVDCRVRSGDFEWKVLAHPRANLRKGDKVFLRLDPAHTLAVQP